MSSERYCIYKIEYLCDDNSKRMYKNYVNNHRGKINRNNRFNKYMGINYNNLRWEN